MKVWCAFTFKLELKELLIAQTAKVYWISFSFVTVAEQPQHISIKRQEELYREAIMLCHKPFLKPDEAQQYCNLSRTSLARVAKDLGISKTSQGYYRKEDLDRLCLGQFSKRIEEGLEKLSSKIK